ncbi:ABC transporter ATP-binding protein [Wenyingzhuangia marina]|uniref:Lipoprotein-releasing system ATP-binding protein n=1 Tax=Wenyingzhuangia marina TaxID=1195760 RepID=A0A1M5W6K2_9FLAO|nr:ABC transporter ATP-binding protein [Wenyingzhuangia marina]GGF75634.1 lipoprotein-releasing system ATP-binding protein LolD [Wenyingzhuangia marina]SHH82814.1 lipoprotein-releasing system ATP-binding protein [Wenyingzhuangia marina]
MIIAKNIRKTFNNTPVLKGIDLHIKKGEIVAIVGPSGAGKTTLLQILSTLDKPDEIKESELRINSISPIELNDKKISEFRNEHIGFVFQFHQLLPEFTAIENVCIPAYIGNKKAEATKQRALELLDFLGIKNKAESKPNQLSGGEQQRVAVARALINQPAIVFADEPSGNLDTESAANLHDLFFELRDKFDQTFVIVTHNEKLANMADRKLTMRDGYLLNE